MDSQNALVLHKYLFSIYSFRISSDKSSPFGIFKLCYNFLILYIIACKVNLTKLDGRSDLSILKIHRREEFSRQLTMLVVRLVGLVAGSPAVGTIGHSDLNQHGQNYLYA